MPRIIDAAKRDRNAISIYGCPEVDALALNEGRPLREPGGLALAYTTQRLAARRRGIGWELTFEQWLRLWRASGRLADRGVGAGRYCMALICSCTSLGSMFVSSNCFLSGCWRL